MKKLFLLVLAITFFSNSHAQDLVGKILFSHYNHTLQSDTIYSMENNGTNVTAITLGYRPRLSHNGKYMAFSNGPLPNQNYNSNIWMRDLVVEHDTLIVSNSNDYIDYYDFSPSDTKVVYAQGCNLYTSNIDGTNSYTYVGCVPCDCWSDDPTVRLSDSLIVYHNYHYGIYTSGFDGSNPTALPHTYPGDLYPIWSPDGQWISYLKSDPTLLFLNNIYKIKPDGSDSTKLTSFALTDTLTPDPVWASDMQSVYVIGRINSQIGLYRVNVDGSGIFTLIKAMYDGGSAYDYWLGLADSVSSNPIGIAPVPSVPIQFSLSPNPSSSQVSLVISVSHSEDVTVELFDLLGKKMLTIYSGKFESGNHSLQFNAESLPAGNYLVRLSSKDGAIQKKLVVTN